MVLEEKTKKPKGPVAPPRTKFNIKKNDPITDLTEFKKKEAEKKEPKKPPVPKRPPKPERVKAGVAKAPALESIKEEKSKVKVLKKPKKNLTRRLRS